MSKTMVSLKQQKIGEDFILWNMLVKLEKHGISTATKGLVAIIC